MYSNAEYHAHKRRAKDRSHDFYDGEGTINMNWIMFCKNGIFNSNDEYNIRFSKNTTVSNNVIIFI